MSEDNYWYLQNADGLYVSNKSGGGYTNPPYFRIFWTRNVKEAKKWKTANGAERFRSKHEDVFYPLRDYASAQRRQ